MNELSQEDTNRLTDLILAGQKIEAIKVYRDITGMGLRESKEFIDEFEAQLREANPDFIFVGQKIAAIKMHKEATGLGLKESKDVIDALEKQLREECPENFTHVGTSGCAVVLVGGLLALTAATWILG
jgi:ribosomal protein L7/L12